MQAISLKVQRSTFFTFINVYTHRILAKKHEFVITSKKNFSRYYFGKLTFMYLSLYINIARTFTHKMQIVSSNVLHGSFH